MDQPVIEVVAFKLVDGVSDAEFLKSAEAATAFVRGCGGFVRRTLSKSVDGTWLEHVEWRSMDEAKAAAAAFPAQESLKPFMASIDMSTLEMRHDAVMLQAD